MPYGLFSIVSACIRSLLKTSTPAGGGKFRAGWPDFADRAVFGAGMLTVFAGGCGLPFSSSIVDERLTIAFNTNVTVTPVEAVGEPVFRREALFTSIEGKTGSHGATVTAFADGELLAAWYSHTGPHELDGSAIYMSRRGPADAAWGEPWLHIDRPAADGNPVLYSEGDRVWLFQAVSPGGWSAAHVEMQTSTDRGATWSEPVTIAADLGSNVRYPPVRTAEGRLLLPAYNDLLMYCDMLVSDDGLTWTSLGAIAPQPPAIQPSVAVRGDGVLLAVMRNGEGGWMWVSGSYDSGHTWSPPTDSGFANAAVPAALLQLASGNLLLVFNDSPTARTPLSAALSADGGQSWPVRSVLVGQGQIASYPSPVQTADGLIHVLYSIEHEHIEEIVVNESWLVQASEGDGPAAVE